MSDIDLSDALFILSEMAHDEKLSDKEIKIIESMFDRIFLEENDEIEFGLDEAVIADHGDTHDERNASFTKTTMSDRIKNRIYQRRYRKSSNYKMRAKKRALVAKRCNGKNQSVQIAAKGSNTYTCKLKDKFRSKLMRRVAQRYR